jgi:G3E family GTPase
MGDLPAGLGVQPVIGDNTGGRAPSDRWTSFGVALGMSSAPVPLTLITGFLGAGKTTLLNRILHSDHGLKIAVLVNDFGAINIDSQLVVGIEGETISLANGCICCTIRDDFVGAIHDVLRRADPPDYLIVETSGVSDPMEIALTFQTIQTVRIDSILTVVDAEQFLDTERQYPVLALNQVGMADIVVLNKIDLISEAERGRLHRYIRDIMPKSRIFETTHGNIPLELILNVGAYDVSRVAERAGAVAGAGGAETHHAAAPRLDVHVHEAGQPLDHAHERAHTDHSLVFETWNWTSAEPVSVKALRRMVNDLPVSVYRAKGIFHTADAPEQPLRLHVVGQRVSMETAAAGWGDAAPRSQFVVIGQAGVLDADDLQRRLDACLAANAPRSELERLAGGVIGWLRGKR